MAELAQDRAGDDAVHRIVLGDEDVERPAGPVGPCRAAARLRSSSGITGRVDGESSSPAAMLSTEIAPPTRAAAALTRASPRPVPPACWPEVSCT